jgi:hypothetical protein
MKRYIIAALALLAIPALAAEVQDWNAVDNSNVDLAPENMSPALVNDAIRAVQGANARWSQDQSCSIASAGSSSAWTLSAARTLTSYYDGLKLCFDVHTDNDGAVTLNVDSLGAVAIRKENGANLEAGDLDTGMKAEVVYNGSSFQLLSPVITTSINELIANEGDLIRGNSSGDGARLPIGTPGQFLYSNGANASWSNLPVASTSVTGVQENADQSDMESLASTRTVTPDQVVASPYAAKGFVRFTVPGSAIGNVTGQNVASVAYNGTGDYTVEWDTDFSSATYTCTATTQIPSGTNAPYITAITAGALTVLVQNSVGTAGDPAAVNVICFGDQ